MGFSYLIKHICDPLRLSTHVKTPGSDSVSCQPLESSSPDIANIVRRMDSNLPSTYKSFMKVASGANWKRLGTGSCCDASSKNPFISFGAYSPITYLYTTNILIAISSRKSSNGG